jgi:hypothetical protein
MGAFMLEHDIYIGTFLDLFNVVLHRRRFRQPRNFTAGLRK